MAFLVAKCIITIVLISVWAQLNICVSGASYESFLLAHTVDPEVDKGTSTWSKAAWQSWLVKRNADFKKECPKCRPLVSKPINSVVAATKREIENSFANKNTLTKYANEYHWSKNPLQIYVFKINTSNKAGTPRVFDCGKL